MAANDWERLLAHLGTLGAVLGVNDSRIELNLDGKIVPVLMTPADWEETVGVVWGGHVDGALQDVSRAVQALGPDDSFLVYENYELHASTSEETPMQREDREFQRRLAQRRRENPDAEFGWYAERRDGTVAKFPQPPDRPTP